MKALGTTAYGGPEVLAFSDESKPEPAAGEVLVRTAAASINAADYRIMRADPFLVRVTQGLLAPRNARGLGRDFAGTVESMGDGVTAFAPGTPVFGYAPFDRPGAFAEYISVPAEVVARMPERSTYVEAASIPLAGVTALQAIRDLGRVRRGESVLIQGAGGGVGTLLLQLAKTRGANVTAVCGPGSASLVRRLGADRVVDYTTADFAQLGQKWDVAFAVNGYRSLRTYRDCLKEGGRYVVIGGTSGQLFGGMLLGRLVFGRNDTSSAILTLNHEVIPSDLGTLRDLVEDGKLVPVIDRVFAFENAVEAFRYVDGGHVQGKVVLDFAPVTTQREPAAA